MLWPLVIEMIDGLSDCGVELANGAESLAGEEMAFEVAPGALNIVEFGSVSWQPLDGQPWSFVEGGAAELAGMDWSVVEHQHDRLFEMPGSWAIERVELFQQSDEIAATLGRTAAHDQAACGMVKGTDERQLARPAGSRHSQIGAAPGPGVRQIRMGQRLGLVLRQHKIMPQACFARCGHCLVPWRKPA